MVSVLFHNTFVFRHLSAVLSSALIAAVTSVDENLVFEDISIIGSMLS